MKPIEEMTAAEIAEEKRQLVNWFADLAVEGGYSLAALRRAYEELVNQTDEDDAAEHRTRRPSLGDMWI